MACPILILYFFFQAEDGIRDTSVTGVQTCALPICGWRRLDDRLHRAHGDAVAAARARGQKADLVRRAGGPEVAPRRHPALGAHGHLLQQPAERVAEEAATIVRARVHQKLGDRLTCHRHASRPFPETLSAANWKGATTSGTSNRSVQSRSPS